MPLKLRYTFTAIFMTIATVAAAALADSATAGRMGLEKTLGESLSEHGKKLAVVSSGSTGSALLVSPRAPKGVGVLLNAAWEPGVRVAFPDAVNDAVLKRFPAAPTKGGAR